MYSKLVSEDSPILGQTAIDAVKHPEAYIANELRGWSSSLEGRAQLAVQNLADALDLIPLAENVEMVDTMTDLWEKQNMGIKRTGVDVRNTKVTDMFKEGCIRSYCS